jgi:hypothetical protein
MCDYIVWFEVPKSTPTQRFNSFSERWGGHSRLPPKNAASSALRRLIVLLSTISQRRATFLDKLRDLGVHSSLAVCWLTACKPLM